MANCCDGKKNHKVKEWGTEGKKSNSTGNIKLFGVIAVVIIAGIIVFILI